MAILNRAVLTINSGSSSIKASMFSSDGFRSNFRYEHLHEHDEAFNQLMNDLAGNKPDIVGHRFVHGGDIVEQARLINTAERARIEGLIHLAPLHLPGNLLGLDMCLKRFNVPQVACFDTAFHATMPDISKRLPIPDELGLHRFGFHGLNYAYVARVLPDVLGDAAYGKVVVAHLGNGSSLCLMENLKSLDTTMGYTPAGGIPMGTRSGDLDPGVMLGLAKRYNIEQLYDMVFHRMGLLALSGGESSEMNVLLSSSSKHARFAIDYYCRQVRAAIGGFAAKAGGIDALVFSGGIGEYSPEIRSEICNPLRFLGFELNSTANQSGKIRIEHAGSKPILVIPADEEAMIRDLCLKYLSQPK